uniref:CCT domain-containing protein n=1 Tax=Fagus sylvatica TaxID=28930 RepID=A0A2N9FHK6_FAGSY
MGYNSFLRSPKKEEQQVPDSVLTKISNTKDAYDDEEFDIMDELEGIWGFEGDEKFPQDNKYDHQLSWDFMDWEGFPKREGEDEDEEEQKVFENTKQCFFEEEESYYSKDIKRENIGVLDDDEMRASLNLNLNYEEVLDAWSNRGSLWADDSSPSMASNGNYMGEVPVMEEERTRREASVLRYKEKRQTRLFSKKIRYQVRKLNADKRPRLKGRFVKRVS